ncbi:4-hydroxy-3-polyprenylbenzoate decarboxylase [Alteromonadaceae bacterium 2753L.S.0a.02]|nr:4-hydroxy-3-polyprenylbenzoate decarboxylase [Alteromonadaceae bacterium 2753L.S.0a.02]
MGAWNRLSNKNYRDAEMDSMFDCTVSLAITGASGVQYGLKLLRSLVALNCKVYLMVSSAAEVVMRVEAGLEVPESLAAQQIFFNNYSAAKPEQLTCLAKDDWFAPVASGSSTPAAMVVCPCSGGSLAAIATGASNNLIERAADVALKERRSLILVPREAPYSEIHLSHMLALTRMGAVIVPASPGFYHKPQTIEDLIDFVVARVLSQLGLEQSLVPPWGE